MDYVCWGLEQVHEMRLNKADCVSCAQVQESNPFDYYKKQRSLLVKCHECPKSFHVDCIITRVKRTLWNPHDGTMYVFCQAHGRNVNPALEEVNWNRIDVVVNRVIETHIVTRDVEYVKLATQTQPPPPEVQPRIDEKYLEEQRNQQPSLQEYSKPKPIFAIDYKSKKQQDGKPQPQHTSQLAPLSVDTPEQSEDEAEKVKGGDYSNYFQKPRIDERLYEPHNPSTERSPEPAKKKHVKPVSPIVKMDQQLPPSPPPELQLPEDQGADAIVLRSQSPSVQEGGRPGKNKPLFQRLAT
jgi:hypothetical protein